MISKELDLMQNITFSVGSYDLCHESPLTLCIMRIVIWHKSHLSIYLKLYLVVKIDTGLCFFLEDMVINN